MLKKLTFPQKLLVFITAATVLMGLMLFSIGYFLYQKYPIDSEELRSFQRELGMEPSLSKAAKLIDSARKQIKLADPERAVIHYREAIKEPYELGTTEIAFEELAKLHVIENKYDSAFAVLADGLKTSKKRYELLEQRAFMYKALGKHKEESENNTLAIEDLTKKIPQSPGNGGYYYWLRADQWSKLADKEKATADYRKTLEYYNNDDYVEDKLRLYMFLKHDPTTREAMYEDIEQLTEEISSDQNNADLYHHRGGIFDVLNDLDAAVKDYERAKKIDPEADDYPCHLAKIMVKRKQYEEASRLFKELALRDEEDAPSWNITADTMVLAGLNKEAIEIADKAIKLDPFTPDGYFFKGQALKNLGDKEAGENYIKTGMALGYLESR